jgi:hypothetical protein
LRHRIEGGREKEKILRKRKERRSRREQLGRDGRREE